MFVDKLTKYVYAVPCKTTSGAVNWANMYIEHVMQHHGLSEVIISDRGPQFVSSFNKALVARWVFNGSCLSHVTLRLMARLKESIESLRMCCVILFRLT